MLRPNQGGYAKIRKSNCNTPLPAWQRVYRQLELHKIKNITSYQVNGNLFIVVPLEEE